MEAPTGTNREHRVCGTGGRPRSWLLEDLVGADAPPDDVRIARNDWLSILERGAPVGCPRHLEHTRSAFHALDPQALPELSATAKVLDELRDGGEE